MTQEPHDPLAEQANAPILDPEMRDLLAYEGGSIGHDEAIEHMDATIEWRSRINENHADDTVVGALVEEAEQAIAAGQAAHPGAPLWDELRHPLAHALYHHGHIGHAARLIAGMDSPHTQAAIALGTEETGEESGRLLQEIIGRLTSEGQFGKRQAVVQAAIDWYIQRAPWNTWIPILQRLLTEEDPSYNPVDSWIDSQKLLSHKLREPQQEEKLRTRIDDFRWGETPLPWRMHGALYLQGIAEYIEQGDVDAETNQRIAAEFKKYEELTSTIYLWDAYRADFSITLFRRDLPKLATEIARNISHPAYLFNVVGIADFNRRYPKETAELIALMNTRTEQFESGDFKNF